MNAKLLTQHHLEFVSLKGGCTGLSESVHVKMPHCWKRRVAAHIYSNTVSHAMSIALQTENSLIKRLFLVRIFNVLGLLKLITV